MLKPGILYTIAISARFLLNTTLTVRVNCMSCKDKAQDLLTLHGQIVKLQVHYYTCEINTAWLKKGVIQFRKWLKIEQKLHSACLALGDFSSTIIKHTCTQLIKIFRFTRNFQGSVMELAGVILCRTLSHQEQDWTPLGLCNNFWLQKNTE